jgi:hypothetical protein
MHFQYLRNPLLKVNPKCKINRSPAIDEDGAGGGGGLALGCCTAERPPPPPLLPPDEGGGGRAVGLGEDAGGVEVYGKKDLIISMRNHHAGHCFHARRAPVSGMITRDCVARLDGHWG